MKIEVPNLFSSLQALMNQVPDLKDPRFIALRGKILQIQEKRKVVINANLGMYQFSKEPLLLEFRGSTSEETLSKLVNGIELNTWKQKLEKGAHDQQAFDGRFHQIFSKILQDVEKIRDLLEKGALSSEKQQAVIKHLYPLVHHLIKRAEIASLLAQNVLSGKLSVLAYAELLVKPKENWTALLPGALLMSQWDWLHEHKLIHQSLFLEIRKKGVSEVKGELFNRLEMIRILSKLFKNQWIASKQLEAILKNSSTQAASRLLETLQFFVTKKDIGRLVQQKVTGTSLAAEMMDQLSSVMDSNTTLSNFHAKVLGSHPTIEKAFEARSVEEIQRFLVSELPSSKLKKDLPFHNFREKILNKPSDPPPTGDASSGPSDETQKVLGTINGLQKQLLQAADVMDELMSNHYQKEEAVAFLKDKSILFPDSEQFFRRKLQILKKRVQGGLDPDDQPGMLLAKWKVNIRNSLKLDTQLFKLLEMIKSYDGLELSHEELTAIKDMNESVQTRTRLIQESTDKYAFIHSIKSPENEELVEDLRLVDLSPKLLEIINGILEEQLDFFSPQDLQMIQENVPLNLDEEINELKESTTALYDASLGAPLIAKLIHWGLWSTDEVYRKRIMSQILQSFQTEKASLQQWNEFKTNPLTKSIASQAIKSISSETESLIDQKGKSILNKLKNQVLSETGSFEKIPQAEVKYFANSMMTSEFLFKVQSLVKAFVSLENAPKSKPMLAQDSNETPSDLLDILEEILEMEFFDQRLELILDELENFLPENSVLINEGKALYFSLTGFEY